MMGLDGIAVDQYMRPGESFDINTIGMEFSFILTQATKAAELLSVGSMAELTIRAEKLTLVMRMLNEEYFLAIAMRSDGNFGKCRFLSRMAAPKLVAEL